MIPQHYSPMDPHLAIAKFLITLLTMSTFFIVTISTTDLDKQECTDPLLGLATCLAYFQGSSKAPNTDCCSGLKQLLSTNEKCLCVIVKLGDDPDLPFGSNVTLALGLPNVCNAPADISKCPALLHWDPKSPQAQVFKNYGPASSPACSPLGSPVSSTLSRESPSPSSNSQAKSWKRPMGFEVLVVAGLLLLFLLQP